jgi:Predicted metal-dependent RNase, consists of a metallo-beta-lactamase domain and an RNA-binding KH domain
MEIDFLGGAGEVGRSAILIKDEKNILLDYGIKIDGKTEYPLPAPRVDAYIPSHAHLDHSGFAPALYKSGLPAAFGTEPQNSLQNCSLKILSS